MAGTDIPVNHNKKWDYPETPRQEITEDKFGARVSDPYRWLEAETPDVMTWTDAQDRFFRAHATMFPHRDRIASRLRELTYIDSQSIPAHRGTFKFFYVRGAMQEKNMYVVENDTGERRILLDPNGWQNRSLRGTWPSRDGGKVAFAVSENNSDKARLYILDVKTGETNSEEVISDVRHTVVHWTPDSTGFYYNHIPDDPTIPEDQLMNYQSVRFHLLGTDPAGDEVVLSPTGSSNDHQSVSLSRDGRYLIKTHAYSWDWTEISVRDLKSADIRFHVVLEQGRGTAAAFVYGDYLYLKRSDGSPRFRLDRVPLGMIGQKDLHWQTIVPEHPAAVLQSASIIGGKLILNYTENLFTRIAIYSPDGRHESDLEFPGMVTASVSGQMDRDELYVFSGSLGQPPLIEKISITTGDRLIYWKNPVQFDAQKYTVEQKWYTSRDGTHVPMTLVYRKDLPRDGTAPTLLDGYGGFNVSVLPEYRAGIIPWIESGGVYAIAHIRGGGEFGEEWHEAGKGHKKQNVFDDFIGGAEFLIREKFTSSSRLAIQGASNGGLLMGAMFTQRPDLFGAVVCQVPLLDMLRFHLTKGGGMWTGEYGHPDTESDFHVLHDYSPYHNVQHGASYPATLIMTSEHDDRVDPMHARKMVALLQDANGSAQPVFLRVEPNAGHGGGTTNSSYIESQTDLYAFLMSVFGM